MLTNYDVFIETTRKWVKDTYGIDEDDRILRLLWDTLKLKLSAEILYDLDKWDVRDTYRELGREIDKIEANPLFWNLVEKGIREGMDGVWHDIVLEAIDKARAEVPVAEGGTLPVPLACPQCAYRGRPCSRNAT